MNKDELVGYIQGLLDMSKDAIKISDSELAIKEIEKTLLTLISKSLEKHRISQIKEGGQFFYNAEHYENLCHSPEEDNKQGNWCDPHPTSEKPSNPKNGPNISNHGEVGKGI